MFLEVFLLVVLLVLYCIVIKSLWFQPDVSKVFLVILCMHSVMWFVIPITLRVLLSSSLSENVASYGSFLKYALLESLALLCTALLWRLTRRRFFSAIGRSKAARVTFDDRTALFLVIGAAAIAAVAGSFSTPRTYLEDNARLITDFGTDAFSRDSSLSFLSGVGIAFLLAYITLTRADTLLRKITLAISGVCVSLLIVAQLRGGSRIAVGLPAILFILRAFIYDQHTFRRFMVLGVMLGLIGIVGVKMAVWLGGIRQQREIDFSDLLHGEFNASFREAELEVLEKFDSISSGAVLVDAYGSRFAGLRPYLGAVFALVPRAFWPLKPPPGSYNGDYSGHPARVTALLLGQDENAGNVGVSPVAISVWQLGTLGVILLMVANAGNFMLLNSLFLSKSLVCRAFGIYLVSPPTLLGVYNSPDGILPSIERILVLILIVQFVWRLPLPEEEEARAERFDAEPHTDEGPLPESPGVFSPAPAALRDGDSGVPWRRRKPAPSNSRVPASGPAEPSGRRSRFRRPPRVTDSPGTLPPGSTCPDGGDGPLP